VDIEYRTYGGVEGVTLLSWNYEVLPEELGGDLVGGGGVRDL
jgi:hypothetical protein